MIRSTTSPIGRIPCADCRGRGGFHLSTGYIGCRGCSGYGWVVPKYIKEAAPARKPRKRKPPIPRPRVRVVMIEVDEDELVNAQVQF